MNLRNVLVSTLLLSSVGFAQGPQPTIDQLQQEYKSVAAQQDLLLTWFQKYVQNDKEMQSIQQQAQQIQNAPKTPAPSAPPAATPNTSAAPAPNTTPKK